ncbi:phytanoyl-CoA dioxygenase family protein [Halioxenophilus sp. WMMB6]|uniref:phytanoyl-CoA dioxygenase family protein n=1 Tax=Halioxenophilus sp. WMMB6 TaxID=3073815 RepID=UPI00295E346E|nr:phytanoyl-CoA dioxygenase family protein [Halioxenophilus sp. WMMB6]
MSSPVALTEAQIAQYQRDGAILLKGVLTSTEQTLLEQGLEESYRSPGKRSSRATDPTGQGETFMESFPSQHCPPLQELLAIGRIPEIAARMMRAPSAQLILDQIFYKQRGHIIATPWHQDTPYMKVRGDDMIRVWITADYSPKALTLKIIRGSHRWNVLYSPRLGEKDSNALKKSGDGRILSFNQATDDKPVVPDIDRYPDSFDILTWDVAPGDALVFNGNMLHSAGGMDDYPHSRRAYTTMWGGPQLRYVIPPDNAIPTLADINRHSVPSGAAIGDYPEAFPIGWPRSPA